MKILVTGGSGFIGTNVVEYFSKKDDVQVVNLDMLPPRNKEHIEYWKECDIRKVEELEDSVLSFNPDYIIHLAARTDLDGATVDDYSSNILGVENVLQVSRKVKHLKKILITSSQLVCRPSYVPQHQKEYCPINNYGRSKVETEKLTWGLQPICDWAILRPTSIWGPWFGVPYRNFFDMVIKHMYFHIGHKSSTKTYGYVKNAVYQIEQILNADTTNLENKVFYIGDNPPIYIEDWANEIAGELGYRIPRMPMPLLRVAAWIGDGLKKFGIHFPMTSYRLSNMTHDNIMDLSNTYEIAPNPPFDRITGVKETLNWMGSIKR